MKENYIYQDNNIILINKRLLNEYSKNIKITYNEITLYEGEVTAYNEISCLDIPNLSILKLYIKLDDFYALLDKMVISQIIEQTNDYIKDLSEIENQILVNKYIEDFKNTAKNKLR